MPEVEDYICNVEKYLSRYVVCQETASSSALVYSGMLDPYSSGAFRLELSTALFSKQYKDMETRAAQG